VRSITTGGMGGAGMGALGVSRQVRDVGWEGQLGGGNGWDPMGTQTTCRGWCPAMVEHGMEAGGVKAMPGMAASRWWCL